jgi:hypothetical protein
MCLCLNSRVWMEPWSYSSLLFFYLLLSLPLSLLLSNLPLGYDFHLSPAPSQIFLFIFCSFSPLKELPSFLLVTPVSPYTFPSPFTPSLIYPLPFVTVHIPLFLALKVFSRPLSHLNLNLPLFMHFTLHFPLFCFLATIFSFCTLFFFHFSFRLPQKIRLLFFFSLSFFLRGGH